MKTRDLYPSCSFMINLNRPSQELEMQIHDLHLEAFTLNLLFLSELFYPHGGGAELATYLYAKLLSAAGVNVVVLTNKFPQEREVSKGKNLLIYRLPLFQKNGSTKYSILSRFDVFFSRFFNKLVKWADVVYVPRFWYSAILLAKLRKKPVVVHLHDYIPICPLSNFFNAFEGTTCRGQKHCDFRCIYLWEKTRGRKILETVSSVVLNTTIATPWRKMIKLSDAVVCVSQTHRKIIVEADASFEAKTHFIYNPLPSISYRSVKGDDFGYFGGPNYLKGFHILYQAVKGLNREGREAVNVHVTNFSDFSSSFLTKLRKQGFFPHGRLTRKQLESIYERIRCAIIPSIWQETFSYAVIEALLCGRLVIASEIGAIPEVTRNCDGVFLFPAGDVEQLMMSMSRVRDFGRESMIDLGIKNREVIERRFSNERTIKDFMRLLYSVANDA